MKSKRRIAYSIMMLGFCLVLIGQNKTGQIDLSKNQTAPKMSALELTIFNSVD